MKQPGCIKMFYKISIPIIFLFITNIQAMRSSDFHYDAIDYEICRTCLRNGTPLPVSEAFSFDDIEAESPQEALLALNQFVLQQHKIFHDALLEAFNDIDDDEQAGLVQAMLSLGIGISYKSGVLTTRHRPLDAQEIIYITSKQQADA